jgi:hypothetical protein
MHEVLRLLFLSARDFFREQALDEPVRACSPGRRCAPSPKGPSRRGRSLASCIIEAVDDGLFRCTAEGGLVALVRALVEAASTSGRGAAAVRPRPPAHHGRRRRGHRCGRSGRGSMSPPIGWCPITTLRRTFTGSCRRASWIPRTTAPFARFALSRGRWRGSASRSDGLPDFPGVESEALRGTLVVAPEHGVRWSAPGTRPSAGVVCRSQPSRGDRACRRSRDPGAGPGGQARARAWVQYCAASAWAIGPRCCKPCCAALRPFFAGALVAWCSIAEVSLPERSGSALRPLRRGSSTAGRSGSIRPSSCGPPWARAPADADRPPLPLRERGAPRRVQRAERVEPRREAPLRASLSRAIRALSAAWALRAGALRASCGARARTRSAGCGRAPWRLEGRAPPRAGARTP